mmetsp:Transcript_57796/g.164206  ORF Transcript_57796/g.164206 Transcript_57796/m.164206 type:complete len:356 (+) Transcript_57796:2408-3475(+)
MGWQAGDVAARLLLQRLAAGQQREDVQVQGQLLHYGGHHAEVLGRLRPPGDGELRRHAGERQLRRVRGQQGAAVLPRVSGHHEGLPQRRRAAARRRGRQVRRPVVRERDEPPRGRVEDALRDHVLQRGAADVVLRVHRGLRPVQGRVQGREEHAAEEPRHEAPGVAADRPHADLPALLRARLGPAGQAGLHPGRPLPHGHGARGRHDAHPGRLHVRQGAARLHQAGGQGLKGWEADVGHGVRCAQLPGVEGQRADDAQEAARGGQAAAPDAGGDEKQRGRGCPMEGDHAAADAGRLAQAHGQARGPLRRLQARRGRGLRRRGPGRDRALRRAVAPEGARRVPGGQTEDGRGRGAD